MTVTKVNLRTDLMPRPNSRLLACGSIELDGVLKIEYVRVVKTHDGRVIVAMPSRLGGDGRQQDVVHPTGPELRAAIQAAVLEELARMRPGDSRNGALTNGKL